MGTRKRRPRYRRAGVGVAILALSGGLLASDVLNPGAAQALTPPVAITADELPTWQTNGIVWSLAEAGGTVFVGGTFSTVRPPGAAPGTQEQNAVNFVALDAATGSPVAGCDLSFTSGSTAASVRAMAVSPDRSTLYVGGSFGSVNGVGASNVAAFDTATCARKPFNAAVNATVRSLAASDDRVYLAGDFTNVGGQARQRFAAVNTTGAVQSWVANADESGRAIEVTPDGENVILGGDFFTLNGADSHALAVVDAGTGANVRNYPLGFIERRSVVKGLAVDDTGFYTANEGTGGGAFDGRIALNLSNFNERWRDTCLGATQDVTIHQDVVYSGHHAHDCASMGAFPDGPRFHLFAQSVDDPELLGWFPDTNDGLGESIGPRVLTTAENLPQDDRDFIWVGGGFTTVNGQPQWGITRFATGPDTGDPERPEVHAHSPNAGEVEVTWRSSLDLDDSLLTYHVYRQGTTAPVHTVDGSSNPWNRPQLSFTDTSVTPGQSYTYRVTATDAAGNTSAQSLPATVTAAMGNQPYAHSVLTDNPVLYWRFDETSGFYAADLSGNDNSGVHRGNPSRGITPSAVPYPGARGVGYTGGITTYTYSDTSFQAPSQYSVETWFRTTSTQGGKLIGFGRNIWRTSTTVDKHVYMRNDGRLSFGAHAGTRQVVTTPAAYNNGEWHHVVATQGSNGMRLYVNGQLVGQNNVTGGQNFRGYWRTGADNLASWPNRPASDGFQGQLDETAVYHHVLPQARVTAHYNARNAPVDTVTTVTASADTYVNQAAPSATHGTSTSLASRSTPGYETYLRFALPDAPAGTVLKAASLRLRTNTQTYAGSEDSQSVVPVTGTWTEAGTSWSSRPSVDSGTVLGTIEAGTDPNTHYTTSLDTAELAGALGSAYDVAVLGDGPDNFWFWSREVGAVDNRPQLLLTFGAP